MNEATIPAVWRDPMGYEMQKDGPPYLPVTATQRQEARAYVFQRQAAFYDVVNTTYAPLSTLLALLRAAYLIHQTAHWQTRGGHYYSDHILFQRIYEESLEGIDNIAERLIGLSRPEDVSVTQQVQVIQSIIGSLCQGSAAPDATVLAQRSLDVEALVIKVITDVKARIEENNGLTEGLDDLLQGLANKHEEFVYLLKQRNRYTYDRR